MDRYEVESIVDRVVSDACRTLQQDLEFEIERAVQRAIDQLRGEIENEIRDAIRQHRDALHADRGEE